jgi:hypothetical protein
VEVVSFEATCEGPLVEGNGLRFEAELVVDPCALEVHLRVFWLRGMKLEQSGQRGLVLAALAQGDGVGESIVDG